MRNCASIKQQRSLKLNSLGIIQVPTSLSQNLLNLYISKNKITTLNFNLPNLKSLNASYNYIKSTQQINCTLPSLQILLIHHNHFTKIEIDYVQKMFDKFFKLKNCDNLSITKIKSFRLDWFSNWNGLEMQKIYRKHVKIASQSNCQLLQDSLKQFEEGFKQNQLSTPSTFNQNLKNLQQMLRSILLYFDNVYNPLLNNFFNHLAKTSPQIDYNSYKTDPLYKRDCQLYLFYRMCSPRPSLHQFTNYYTNQQPYPKEKPVPIDIYTSKSSRRNKKLNCYEDPQKVNIIQKIQFPKYGAIDRIKIFPYDVTFMQGLLLFILNKTYRTIKQNSPPTLKLSIQIPVVQKEKKQRKLSCCKSIGNTTRSTVPYHYTPNQKKPYIKTISKNIKHQQQEQQIQLFMLSQSRRDQKSQLGRISQIHKLLQMKRIRPVFLAWRDLKWRIHNILLYGKVFQGLIYNLKYKY